jgi:hypothetical protein
MSEVGERQATSLFRDTADQNFWEVAPYLFSLEAELMEWIVSIATIEGWGIFIASKIDITALRHHLRHFLRVQEPLGQAWFFRFYDARVLEPFLPACNELELRTFFGPVQAYGIAAKDVKQVTFFQEPSTAPAGVSVPQPSYGFMFRLRDQHIDALRPQAEAEFIVRIAAHLKKQAFPEVSTLDDEALMRRIRLGLTRARRYRMLRESTLVAYVALMFQFAPNFDELPKFAAVLADRKIPPDDRIDELVSCASDGDWQEVIRRSDPNFWNNAEPQLTDTRR